MRRVKFGGNVLVRPAVRNVERQCGLIERATCDADARSLAAERLPPIGADSQTSGQRLSLPGCDGDDSIVRRYVLGLAIDPREVSASTARASMAAISVRFSML